jgi:hypothetical protein
VREATLVETCQRLTFNSDGPYQATGTPKSLDHKFITEDVPTGLIPMSALGRAAGVRTPAIDALVETVRNMTGKDFAADARTLEHLGPSGMKFRPERVATRAGFGRVRAVQHQDLYEIKSSLILQPGPAALTDGLADLVKIIHRWAAR